MVNVEGSEHPTETETAPDRLTALNLHAPSLSTKVFKDECMYCFHTPFFKGGLFVCLEHFLSLCSTHVVSYYQANGCKYFLHVQNKKIRRDPTETSNMPKNFCILTDKEEHEEKNTLVVAPNFQTDIEINETVLDQHLYHVVQAVIRHSSATYQDQMEAGVSEWDGSERKILPNAENLVQLNVDKTIPYSDWVCEEPGCGLTENLWLNLCDGTIYCGRFQYIAEGKTSKGNSHAKFHAERTGFGVAVKLGTIQDGDADCYSYAESESFRNPYLRQHLAHFGLDMDKFEKTEKSTFELELDLNQKWEWSRCQEDGMTLENVYGNGFSGLINIGSSCYINSVLQMLLMNPTFVKTYTSQFNTLLTSQQLIKLYENFNFQLVKLVSGLLSGEYAKEDNELNGIKPTQFRRVAGRGHPEFSTSRQQDAEEYIRYLFNKIEETLPIDSDPVDDFRFKVVKRFQDIASGKVRYEDNEDFLLALPIPKDKLKDLEGSSEMEVPQSIAVGPLPKIARKYVNLSTLIEHYASVQMIEGFISPITNEAKGALQSYSVGTFPKFLLIQINRYEHDERYVSHKLDVDVNVPERLNLSSLRFTGIKEGEELLPDFVDVPEVSAQRLKKPVFNENHIAMIMDIGFSRRVAETAFYATNNSGYHVAEEWLLAHMHDENFDSYHYDNAATAKESAEKNRSSAGGDNLTTELVNQLVNTFGVTPHEARYSLQQANNDINAAAEWYLTHSDQIPSESTIEEMQRQQEFEMATALSGDEQSASTSEVIKKKEKHFYDGPPEYVLRGFITHMGNSPHSGHYVCHLNRNNVWYLYNDEKVAVSQNPPKTLGYIYLYEQEAFGVS